MPRDRSNGLTSDYMPCGLVRAPARSGSLLFQRRGTVPTHARPRRALPLTMPAYRHCRASDRRHCTLSVWSPRSPLSPPSAVILRLPRRGQRSRMLGT